MQESYLFNRTVRENIAHSRPTATLTEVVNAASLAGANAFILALRESPDLNFDEATSALDDESQSEIQKTWPALSPIARLLRLPIAYRPFVTATVLP